MKTVVIARYREDIAWANQLWTNLWAENPIEIKVVQKDTDCPNEGREPFSFLWYIISHYNQLEGEYYFVQGHPFDHCPKLQEEIVSGVPLGFKWMGRGDLYVSDGKGSPHHRGIPVEDVCCRLTNKCGLDAYSFTPGGQFAVTAERIKNKPLHYYLLALTIMSEDFGTHPWCFERLWEKIFED